MLVTGPQWGNSGLGDDLHGHADVRKLYVQRGDGERLADVYLVVKGLREFSSQGGSTEAAPRLKLARSLGAGTAGRAREGGLPRPQEWEGARPDAELTRRRRMVLELKTVDPGWLRITTLPWRRGGWLLSYSHWRTPPTPATTRTGSPSARPSRAYWPAQNFSCKTISVHE